MGHDRRRTTAERRITGHVDAADGARIAYLRPAPPERRRGTPVVVLPGGPGLASALPYHSLRRRALARGLDVVMPEHRGVGLSRRDGDGADLPVSAVTTTAAADDVAAVLDREGIDRAVVYGTSYGSYLAQVFGARHPRRVAGMVLDSPLLSAEDRETVRSHRRALLLHGHRRLPTLVREAVAAGEDRVGHVAQVVYEFAGPDALDRLLEARLRGGARVTWQWLSSLGKQETSGEGAPFVAEFDLVAGITYGELGYGAKPDGLPLDPQAEFAPAAEHAPPFTGDTVDLPAALPGFDWPTAVVSGAGDLRTPRPVAERVAELLPRSVLVDLPGNGHSALDTHQLAALHVARHVERGDLDGLRQRAHRIAALPRRGMSSPLGPVIRTAVRLGA